MFSSTTESLGTQCTGTLAALAIVVLHEWWECVTYHLYTAFLFSRSDFKTILFPVVCIKLNTCSRPKAESVLQSAFACAVAPVHSILLLGMLWIGWTHQLMCNVSNQARSCDEDAINKPWRPLSSGRITERHAAYPTLDVSPRLCHHLRTLRTRPRPSHQSSSSSAW